MTTEEIKKDRSRNYPKLSLADAVEQTKKMYQKAGKAKISPENAVGALGYNGLNGAALTTLGALSQYGLVDRERGKSVSVSPLAIRLIHPLNAAQELAAKREAALMPKVFSELYSQEFHKCDDDIIANHLIQNEFTPDGAKKAAAVFKANISLAELHDNRLQTQHEVEEKDEIATDSPQRPPVEVAPECPTIKGKTVIAEYSIPLGSNEATISITGEKLSPEDFDALSDYVAIFKKQFERKMDLGRIKGVIVSEPSLTSNRVTFLVQLESGRQVSCLSGAGSPFTVSHFTKGQQITLFGERKSDFSLGQTPYFVFTEIE